MARPTRGQVFWCKWRGVTDSLTVRAAAQPDIGWSINRYGLPSWVAEVCDQVLTHEQAARLETEKSLLQEDLKDLECNLEWGHLLPRTTYVIVYEWMLTPYDTEGLRPLWTRWGRCPSCGHGGDWIRLGLICPYHGKFAG